MADDELYVGIFDSESLQRDLLGARKETLVILKRFEKAMLLREQRLYLEAELRSAIRELSHEIHEVMSSFPDLPEDVPESVEQIPEPKKTKDTKEEPVKPTPMNHLDQKLADIDKRLSQL